MIAAQQQREFLTSKEACERLRVTNATLRRYRIAGKVRAVQRGATGNYLYVASSIEAYLIAGQQITPPSSPTQADREARAKAAIERLKLAGIKVK